MSKPRRPMRYRPAPRRKVNTEDATWTPAGQFTEELVLRPRPFAYRVLALGVKGVGPTPRLAVVDWLRRTHSLPASVPQDMRDGDSFILVRVAPFTIPGRAVVKQRERA